MSSDGCCRVACAVAGVVELLVARPARSI